MNLILPHDTDSRLGRREPQDWEHVERYSLTMETMPLTATPVILGINWYEAFYTPVKIGRRLWIGLDHKNLGRLMGGHCVCIKPPSLTDLISWWVFYNQGREGACVGFGTGRGLSLFERIRFDARQIYLDAQLVDRWGDTPPEEGTSVRAAMDILRDKGAPRVVRGKTLTYDPQYGINTNRWARTVDEIIAALNAPQLYDIGGVPILNSWGREYPHIVYMPLETLQRVLNEYGEATLFTPR